MGRLRGRIALHYSAAPMVGGIGGTALEFGA